MSINGQRNVHFLHSYSVFIFLRVFQNFRMLKCLFIPYVVKYLIVRVLACALPVLYSFCKQRQQLRVKKRIRSRKCCLDVENVQLSVRKKALCVRPYICNLQGPLCYLRPLWGPAGFLTYGVLFKNMTSWRENEQRGLDQGKQRLGVKLTQKRSY